MVSMDCPFQYKPLTQKYGIDMRPERLRANTLEKFSSTEACAPSHVSADISLGKRAHKSADSSWLNCCMLVSLLINTITGSHRLCHYDHRMSEFGRRNSQHDTIHWCC